MFDVLDPVIVDTVLHGSFDPAKYTQIDEVMEEWGEPSFSTYFTYF